MPINAINSNATVKDEFVGDWVVSEGSFSIINSFVNELTTDFCSFLLCQASTA